MKYLFILSGVVCLSFMLLPACAPQAEQQAEPVVEEAPNTEADVAAIKSILADAWSEAVKQEDVDALMSLYSDDAINMPSNEPACVGRQAIRARHERNFETTSYEIATTIDEVIVSGEWAFVRGNDTNTETPKSGGESTVTDYKWVILMHRQADDSWKILWEIGNTNAPPAEPTT
jgi:uncharacterized protein (TIGR02246 family)